MGKPLINLLNRVLRETGRAEVKADTIDSDSLVEDTKFVLDMINDKQRQLANEFNWDALKQTDTFQTEDGKKQYVLEGKKINTGSGEKYKRPHPQKITYMEHQQVGDEIVPQTSDTGFHSVFDSGDTGDPEYFRTLDVNKEGLPIIEFSPEPDGSFNIYYEYYEKPDDLERSDDISPVPERPLFWGTVEAILEFDGVQFQRAAREFRRSLQVARANNNANVDIQMGGDARIDGRHPLDNVNLPLGNP